MPVNQSFDLSYLDNLANHPQAAIEKEQLQEIQRQKMALYQEARAMNYREALFNLPEIEKPQVDINQAVIQVGKREDLRPSDLADIYKSAKCLVPWRKGPYQLFGMDIDSEWRSDLKWERIKDFIGDIEDKTVLDIGCNNGYFLFRLAAQRPKLALGIDPVLHTHAQFSFLQHFLKVPNVKMEMWGVEHLVHFKNCFDVILSMGVIYHHRNPMEQLQHIYQALRPGGVLILESIGIPEQGSHALFPPGRYALMKNVWFVPTPECLMNWVSRSQFLDVQLVSQARLTEDEQRSTSWSAPVSLAQQLDAKNQDKTVEGHPAPWRYVVKARKKWP